MRRRICARASKLPHAGLWYEWDSEDRPEITAVADAPPWVLQLLLTNTSNKCGHTSAEWQAIIDAGRHEGSRNQSLASIVGHLLRPTSTSC